LTQERKMFASHKTFTKGLLLAGATAVFVAAGCSGDDEATKDDAAATEEPAAEEAPAAEEPAPAAEEEPAAEAGPDMSIYDRAARITEATAADGKHAVRLKKVTADGGYAACGLQDDDIVSMIDGAEVPTGKPGVDALMNACANKGKITVERGGETMTLNE
jgi:hypothetical protein